MKFKWPRFTKHPRLIKNEKQRLRLGELIQYDEHPHHDGDVNYKELGKAENFSQIKIYEECNFAYSGCYDTKICGTYAIIPEKLLKYSNNKKRIILNYIQGKVSYEFSGPKKHRKQRKKETKPRKSYIARVYKIAAIINELMKEHKELSRIYFNRMPSNYTLIKKYKTCEIYTLNSIAGKGYELNIVGLKEKEINILKEMFAINPLDITKGECKKVKNF